MVLSKYLFSGLVMYLIRKKKKTVMHEKNLPTEPMYSLLSSNWHSHLEPPGMYRIQKRPLSLICSLPLPLNEPLHSKNKE